jgi:hypothetical protein
MYVSLAPVSLGPTMKMYILFIDALHRIQFFLNVIFSDSVLSHLIIKIASRFKRTMLEKLMNYTVLLEAH